MDPLHHRHNSSKWEECQASPSLLTLDSKVLSASKPQGGQPPQLLTKCRHKLFFIKISTLKFTAKLPNLHHQWQTRTNKIWTTCSTQLLLHPVKTQTPIWWNASYSNSSSSKQLKPISRRATLSPPCSPPPGTTWATTTEFKRQQATSVITIGLELR